MNKKIARLLIAASLLVWPLGLRADEIPHPEVPTGMQYRTFISSFQVTLTSGTARRGAATLYGLELSTGNGIDSVVCFDTVAAQGITLAALQAATTQQQMTPFFVFTSTGNTNGNLNQQAAMFWPYGILASTGIFCVNTGATASSGSLTSVYYK